MGLMSDNGFLNSLSDSKNIAIATYSFPLLSILGSVLMMFLDISELFVAKIITFNINTDLFISILRCPI